MKTNELIAIVIAMIAIMLFSLWAGAGIALTACANSQEGYTHKFFNDGYKAYCEIKK